jgi:hypothetical protein
VILEEAVLRKVAGSPDVMREQLTHLASTGESPNVTIRVLPFKAGVVMVMGPFFILQFPDPNDTDVVYLEGALLEDVIDRQSDTERYHKTYEQLRDMCLEPAESLNLIKQIASEL